MGNYYSPTPKKFRQIGDAILIGCASLSALIVGSPLSDNAQKWVIFSLSVLGVLGKVISNFAKTDEPDAK